VKRALVQTEFSSLTIERVGDVEARIGIESEEDSPMGPSGAWMRLSLLEVNYLARALQDFFDDQARAAQESPTP